MIPVSFAFKASLRGAPRFATSTSPFSPRFLNLSQSRSVSHQAVEKGCWSKTLADLKSPQDCDEADSHRTMLTRAHPGATMDQLKSVQVSHHTPETTSDFVAQKVLQIMRTSFDLMTGYHHVPEGQENNPKYIMTRDKWLERFVFSNPLLVFPEWSEEWFVTCTLFDCYEEIVPGLKLYSTKPTMSECI